MSPPLWQLLICLFSLGQLCIATGPFVVAFVGILQQVVVILHKQLCKNGKFGTM
jgi:hypothetical protein